jgi:carbamoyl-phosphate synthase small subunit
MPAVENVRKTIQEWNKPVFGIWYASSSSCFSSTQMLMNISLLLICSMGNQILGLAAGFDVYRMQFGNRGHNQPVLALANSGSIKSGRVYITSQNHQYAVELTENFPEGFEPWFINVRLSILSFFLSLFSARSDLPLLRSCT